MNERVLCTLHAFMAFYSQYMNLWVTLSNTDMAKLLQTAEDMAI